MITENLLTLEINKLSAKQYQKEAAADNLNPNAFYLTPMISNVPVSSYSVNTVIVEGEECSLIDFISNADIINLTYDTNEHIIYIPLNNGFSLNGQKILFGSSLRGYADEVTFSKSGDWSSLSFIQDGRGWNEYQVLTLLVKGSGIEGEFEYVRLLNIPYPSAEGASF